MKEFLRNFFIIRRHLKDLLQIFNFDSFQISILLFFFRSKTCRHTNTHTAIVRLFISSQKLFHFLLLTFEAQINLKAKRNGSAVVRESLSYTFHNAHLRKETIASCFFATTVEFCLQIQFLFVVVSLNFQFSFF